MKFALLLCCLLYSNNGLVLTVDNQKKVTICAHPFISAYLSRGLFSRRMKWLFKYKKWVKVRPIYAYHLLQYAFFDKKDDELSL